MVRKVIEYNWGCKEIYSYLWSFGELVTNSIPGNIQAHVELQTECAEDSQADEDFHDLRGTERLGEGR